MSMDCSLLLSEIQELRKENRQMKETINQMQRTLNLILDRVSTDSMKRVVREVIQEDNTKHIIANAPFMDCRSQIVKSTGMDENDLLFLERSAGLKAKSIEFDSDVNKWSMKDSEFEACVMNKGNLAIIVEDYDGNIFGGMLYSKIHITFEQSTQKNDTWMIIDKNSFLFSLQRSWGRSHKKFPIKKGVNGKALCLHEATCGCLFHFGQYHGSFRDIEIFRKGIRKSWTGPSHYNMPNNALRPNGERFEAKRILVIQLSN